MTISNKQNFRSICMTFWLKNSNVVRICKRWILKNTYQRLQRGNYSYSLPLFAKIFVETMILLKKKLLELIWQNCFLVRVNVSTEYFSSESKCFIFLHFAQCENFRIFLPLRFYVKSFQAISFHVNSEQQKCKQFYKYVKCSIWQVIFHFSRCALYWSWSCKLTAGFRKLFLKFGILQHYNSIVENVWKKSTLTWEMFREINLQCSENFDFTEFCWKIVRVRFQNFLSVTWAHCGNFRIFLPQFFRKNSVKLTFY